MNTSWGSGSGGRSVVLVALPNTVSTPILDCSSTWTITNDRWERGELVGKWGGNIVIRQLVVAVAVEYEGVAWINVVFESAEGGLDVPLDKQACLLELNNGIEEVDLIRLTAHSSEHSNSTLQLQ